MTLHPSQTDARKRVAIFLPSLAGGGAEKSMLVLAEGLAMHGCALDLVLAQAKGPHLAQVPASVRVVDLKASRVFFCIPALISYLRRERPDALLSALDYANIAVLWARTLAHAHTRVATNDQNTLSISTQQSRQWRQRIIPQLVRYFYPWADAIIGNSQGVADDLARITGLPCEQIRVIYNPVITAELYEKAKGRPDHPWLEKNQLPTLLAIGRLTAQKDFPTLLQAFARVRLGRPCRLIILGEGPDRPRLEALVRDLQLHADVCLPGFVENPYAYLSRASAFILSSRWEGLPTVLIEALACGVPVISTDCPSGPREILANGKYGVLVPVQDVAALAQAIQLALDGTLASAGEESCRPYELETVVNQYLGVLLG
jgi:glycosyltransferase involved in cell wall biosynthesis